ncbi:hypothetical protein BGZ73_005661 [Actinomortierella ambigua]|nr:hypothetical protein BGZ73_005661 [Actinomortierella ambigua]
MRVKPLQIHWHDKQPIYSAHFEPGPKGRLATAGGDGNVRIWKVVKDQEKDSTHIEFLSSLNRHTAAVNVVRFSPTAEVIASAGDDGNIILWKPAESKESVSRFDAEDDEDARETWRVQAMMRGSLSDIYDLAWSPCGRYIISGSIDNTARIWDTKDSKCIHVIADHHHYVQGVAWDPLGEYVATQSSDRSVQIYSLKLDKNGNVVVTNLGKSTKLDFSKLRGANCTKAEEPKATTTPSAAASSGSNDGAEQTATPTKSGPKSFRLYHDETLTSFFRRLSFTPDGSMLLAPAGQYRAPVQASTASNPKTEESSSTAPTSTTEMETKNTVYIYGRRGLNKGPIAHLPGHKKPSIAVRCNPMLFKLRDIKPPSSQGGVQQEGARRAPSMFGLDYRALYAVATQDSIMIYDTQQSAALVVVSHLHYATFTDMTWSSDGCTLIMTSSDGFCSIISFEEGELGQVHHLPAAPPPTIKTEEQLNLAAGLTKQIDGMTVSDKKDKAEKKEKASTEKKERAAGEKKDKGKGTATDKKATAKRLFSKVQSSAASKGTSSTSIAAKLFSSKLVTTGKPSSSTASAGTASSSSSAAASGDVEMAMAPPNEPTKKKRRIQPTFVSALPGSLPSPSPTTTSASPSTSTASVSSSSSTSPQPPQLPALVVTSVSPETPPTPTPDASGAPSQKKRITPIFVRPL